jgi:hypothetical protein
LFLLRDISIVGAVTSVSRRNILLVGIVLFVGIVLCAGDNHVCAQTGYCPTCLHSPVSTPVLTIAGGTPLVHFGAIANATGPQFRPFELILHLSLRAPPAA